MYVYLNFKRVPILFCLIVFVVGTFTACKGGKESVTGGTTSNNRKKEGKNALLYYSDDVLSESTYQEIRGSVPRLKAIISGRFVQHNTSADSAGKVYSAWKVNGGKDSIVLYQFPVGEPNKDGHWMYHYQFMTSLPDEPVYIAFSKMKEIDRDTIVAVYYEAPKDFAKTVSLTQILAKPESIFKGFDFEHLELSKAGEVVYYARKTPLEYYGVSCLFENTAQESKSGGYNADYYVVSPGEYTFGKEVYNKEKKFLGRTKGDRLIKEARLHPNYIGR